MITHFIMFPQYLNVITGLLILKKRLDTDYLAINKLII